MRIVAFYVEVGGDLELRFCVGWQFGDNPPGAVAQIDVADHEVSVIQAVVSICPLLKISRRTPNLVRLAPLIPIHRRKGKRICICECS